MEDQTAPSKVEGESVASFLPNLKTKLSTIALILFWHTHAHMSTLSKAYSKRTYTYPQKVFPDFPRSNSEKAQPCL